MVILQSTYKDNVSQLLANKEHVADDLASEFFLSLIMNVSFGFAFLAFSMTLYMVLRRRNMIRNKITDSKLKEKYQDFLSNFFTLPNDNSFIGIVKNKQFPTRLEPIDISHKHCRKILANEIFEFKQQLTGQQAGQLSNYFFGLGLQKEALDLVRSRSWTDTVKGMQFVNEFHIQEGLELINSLINHKNREIAIHALVVRISLDNNISSLIEVERKMDSWEWHKIVHEIEKQNLTEINFTKLKELKIQDLKLIAIAEERLNPALASAEVLI